MRLISALLVLFLASSAHAVEEFPIYHDAECDDAAGDFKVRLVFEMGTEDGPMWTTREVLRIVSFETESKKFRKLGFAGIGFGSTDLLQNNYMPLPETIDSNRKWFDLQSMTASGFGGIFAFRYTRLNGLLTDAMLTLLHPEAGIQVIDLKMTCSPPIARTN